MKRLNDLLSGKEDIVVKDAKIIGPNGLEILKDNDNETYYKVTILSTSDGFKVKCEVDDVLTWDDDKFIIAGDILIDTEIRNVDEPTNKIYVGEDNLISFLIQGDAILKIDDSRVIFLKPLILQNYSTAERPSSAYEGAVIYDSTLKKCILYNGSAWVNLDGTALA